MIRILFIKPYRASVATVCTPPLGLLYLASSLREQIGNVHIDLVDMRLAEETPEKLVKSRNIGDYDIVGVSALNFESEAAHEIANAIKQRWPHVITALGGPYVRSSPERTISGGGFDWIFDGEAERTFAAAVRAQFVNKCALTGIAGLIWWNNDQGEHVRNPGFDTVPDLDALPMPAWDLVDFDFYARRPNHNGWLKGTRYASLFTSRGCPYKCTYCHDIFGKKFRWRSAENVLAEIDYLRREYGIDEFHIIDDIFNLHKPRMREIAQRIIETWGERKLHFCFPNGIRADIFEQRDVPLIARMGVFQMAIAIETVTPRLQDLIRKDLDFVNVEKVIAKCDEEGILTKGFFMIGFPTETLEEVNNTIEFAVKSRLTWAGFFLVVPQENTPLHELAQSEAPVALEHITVRDYYSDKPWYEHAYGVDLRKIQQRAFRRFYLQPWRILRIICHVRPESLLKGLKIFLTIVAIKEPTQQRAHGPAESPDLEASETSNTRDAA